MADAKKYFWLRLKRDFFKRHDIQIVEAMPNGKDYILFYLKLLCESVDHEGNLRFSEQIPYNDQMLSTITNTNVDIVRNAIKIFSELGMIDILDDGTFYMNEVQKMIGTSTQDEHTRESTRLRVQAYRERKKQAQIKENRYSNITCNGEIEKEKEIEIEKELESTRTPKEPKQVHGEYSHVRLTSKELNKLCEEYGNQMTNDCITFLDEYIEMKGYKAKNHYLCIRKWVVDAVKERQAKHAEKPNKVADQLEQSYEMMTSWAEEES